MNRNYQLPQPIADFYHASDVYDGELLAASFAEEAVLYDEGMEFHGPREISEHILKANNDAKVSMEITNLTEQNGETVITATLTGEFEGSPLPLDFHFALNEGKITVLTITLTEEYHD